MAKPRTATGMNDRLLRIDFPGMKIHCTRLALNRVQISQTRTGHSIGKQSQISSPRNPPIVVCESSRRGRKLENPMALRSNLPMRESLRVWNSVHIVPDRKNRRIERKSLLG